jgi:hypothetical protein
MKCVTALGCMCAVLHGAASMPNEPEEPEAEGGSWRC